MQISTHDQIECLYCDKFENFFYDKEHMNDPSWFLKGTEKDTSSSLHKVKVLAGPLFPQNNFLVHT